MNDEHLNEEMLFTYLDYLELGEAAGLDSAEIGSIETHLVTCEQCQTQLSDMQTLFNQLATLPEPTLATDLSTLVVEQLEQRTALAPRTWWLMGLQLLLSIGAVAFGWQFLSDVGGRVATPNTILQIQTTASNWWNTIQTEWQTVLASWQQGLESVIDPVSQIQAPMLPVETLALIGVLGAAFLLFGNGMIYRQMNLNAQRSAED